MHLMLTHLLNSGATILLPEIPIRRGAWNRPHLPFDVSTPIRQKAKQESNTKLYAKDLQIVAPTRESSSLDAPDFIFPQQKIHLHILSSKKTYTDLFAKTRDSRTEFAVLGLRLAVYSRIWWGGCNDSEEEAGNAKEQLLDWLQSSLAGRGWLYHPIGERYEEQLKALAKPLQEEYEAKQESVLQRARQNFLREKQASSDSSEAPDEVLQFDVSACRLCNSPVNLYRLGSGIFKGKKMMRCSLNKRHFEKFYD